MKKLFCILVALTMIFSMATMVGAYKTGDLKYQSVEGTAVIDGVKDEAYNSGLILPIIQKGYNNGGGEILPTAIATAHYLNDAEWVYLYVDVIDDNIDNTSSDTWAHDSVEAFWMADDASNQIRFFPDGTCEDSEGKHHDFVSLTTDTGYAVELKFLITDVLNNEIETCVQINACSNGGRDFTVYIEGNSAADDAYQRVNRQTDYDCWWTLVLAGDHADTRVDPIPQAMELTPKNYASVLNLPVTIKLSNQNAVSYDDWAQVGETAEGIFCNPTDFNWTDVAIELNDYDATKTADFTKAPQFRINIGNDTFLAIADDAEIGAEGDSGKFTYTYTDIVLKAEGYADVVIPGGEITQELTVIMEDWGRSGDEIAIDLCDPIMNQLGINVEELCTSYLTKLQSVSGSFTLTSYNLVTKEIMDAYLVTFAAEDEALKASLQEYADAVAAALETAKGTTDVAVLEEAAYEAQKAVNRASKEATNYPITTEWVAGLQTTVDEINALIEAAKNSVADAPADTPADTPADDKPADTTPAPAEGGNTGLIIGIVAAVVVVVVVVIIILSKKKK